MPDARSAECHANPGQTPAYRAAALTQGEAIAPDQLAEILACLALAAQTADATVEGMRSGDVPFKAIRYEFRPEGEE